MTSSPAVDETARRLEEAIRRGSYLPGQRLPSERILAEEQGVSRVTLRRALTRLAEKGAVVSSPQRGWFAAGPAAQPPTALQSFSEMARERGLVATSVILEQVVRPATFAEAESLRVSPASDVLQVSRLRGMGGKVLCLDRSTMPLALVEPLRAADLTDQSLYERLRALCGIEIYRSAYSVHAAAADAELASMLQIPAGSPVLIGEETAYAVDGTPVIVGLTHHRGDAYRFEADLFRPLSGA